MNWVLKRNVSVYVLVAKKEMFQYIYILGATKKCPSTYVLEGFKEMSLYICSGCLK